jgi:hypothetical protein
LLHWSWWQDCLGSHLSLNARGADYFHGRNCQETP